MKTKNLAKSGPARRFNLTYSIITRESATYGDHAYHGYVTKNGGTPRVGGGGYIPKNPARFTLREGVEMIRFHADHIEADSCPCSVVRWITGYPPSSDYQRSGESVTLSLHLPRELSPASARRVSLVLKQELDVYGIRA